MGFGAGEEVFERGLVKAAKDEDLAAGEQRAVQGKGGVLGGGTDEDDGAVLDDRQKAVLLGAVEAVDFIDEEEGALAGFAAAPGFIEGALQIGNAGEDGGERDEMQPGGCGEQARDRGFTNAGRAPEDE